MEGSLAVFDLLHVMVERNWARSRPPNHLDPQLHQCCCAAVHAMVDGLQTSDPSLYRFLTLGSHSFLLVSPHGTFRDLCTIPFSCFKRALVGQVF